MVSILSDGNDGHRLEDADGRLLGSIRNRTIRLGGLASEPEAIDAAVAAWNALDLALSRQFPGWPRHEPARDAIGLVHDGAYEWISDGRRPMARLFRPRADRAAEPSFAIEFVLPSYASEGVAITAAPQMLRALGEVGAPGGELERAMPDVATA